MSLQAQNPAPPDQIDALVVRLQKGTNGHYAGFLQTLRETDQEAIVSEVLREGHVSDLKQLVCILH